jgi:DNA-binding transcriptional ArsR family regulator
VLQRIALVNAQDVCCLVDPGALDPEVRSLGEHLAVSRDLLIALADPMRQDLVQLLARAELNVGEIAERVTLSRPTVSHHLNLLRRAGLAVRVRKRGREIYYRLNKEPIVATLQGLLDSLTCC